MTPASAVSPPRASPPAVRKTGPDLDYLMNIITSCGAAVSSDASDEIPGVEITYDVTTDTNKIITVSPGDQLPSQGEVAQTYDHIHHSDLSPEEKSQMWYTKDEIRKFRTNRRAVKKLKALKKQTEELQAKMDPDDVASVVFKKKPNVYFIQPDGYTSLSEIEKGHYNMDASEIRGLLADNGFKLYNNFRTNYSSTLSTNSAIFSMKHHYLV